MRSNRYEITGRGALDGREIRANAIHGKADDKKKIYNISFVHTKNSFIRAAAYHRELKPSAA